MTVNMLRAAYRVASTLAVTLGTAHASPPATFSGSYAGVMGCHMSAVSFTLAVTPGEGQRIEVAMQGETVSMLPGQRAALPAKASFTGTYEPSTGYFSLQAASGAVGGVTAWRGRVLANGERVLAVPTDLDRAACTPWAASRGHELPAAWATIPAEAAAGMALGTKEGAEAYNALTQADAAQRGECPAPVKAWLMQLHERGPQDHRRQSRQMLRNLYREPEFSRRFGQPFASLSRQERLALAVQVNGACRRDPALALVVSQNRAMISPLLNNFDLSAADVRAAGLAIDEARRAQAELAALVDAALRSEQPLPKLEALSTAAQPMLALLWPDEADAVTAELRRKRQPLLRPYLEAQLAADVASDAPWPRLNNFMTRFEPQMRELGEADAVAVREQHAAKLAAAKVGFDQQHAARVADAVRADEERRRANPPPPPQVRPRPGDVRPGGNRPPPPEPELSAASGPFTGPGAPYANALYQDDALRLDRMDRQFAKLYRDYMESMGSTYGAIGALIGARELMKDVHQSSTAALGEMGLSLTLATSYMVSFEHIFPPSCMDAEPLQFTRTTEYPTTVARNIYGNELWRSPGFTVTKQFRVNKRFKEAFEASGARDDRGVATIDALFRQPNAVKLVDVLDSMRQGMRTMGCDSPDMKRFEANLLKRFWLTKERMTAAREGKPRPR